MRVEFWFEFASTYSYPAAMRIEDLAQRYGATLHWRAFLLGPTFEKQGWNDSPFNVFPVKGRYMWRDLERICARDDIPFRRPSVFPRNGLLAARIACAFETAEWLPAFVKSVYRANFAEDRDIADEKVIAELLNSLGQPGKDIVEQAQSPSSKLRLREQTAEAERRGIFGAPSVLVGDELSCELFWGNDRLDDAFEWYRRVADTAERSGNV